MSHTLTSEQEAIVHHPLGSHARILAVAGSGKTTTMVHRVRYLVTDLNQDPGRIRVVMFNRKAREDFEQSIKDLRYSLEEAYDSYIDALEALELSRISLAAAKERAKITKAKYLNGLSNYDEWYRIETNYSRAQTSLLSSKKQAMLAEALWHKTYGGHVQ